MAKLIVGQNDLATVNPDLAAEWHPTKNNCLRPTQVTAGSNRKVWWKGTCGHEWEAVIGNRSRGIGCPHCSKRHVVEGVNDLFTVNPSLAAEWHPTKNGRLRPMQIAGKLMDKGIAFTDILDKTYFEKTYLQHQITGRALLESMRLMDGRCIISGLRQRDIDFYGVTPTDLDGISALLRNTEGVEVAIFLYEANTQEYKVSMRSKSYIDVQKVAQFFGGGGHVRAAGCTMQGSMHDVVNNLTREIAKQMPEEIQ